jgi:hypothetical protein
VPGSERIQRYQQQILAALTPAEAVVWHQAVAAAERDGTFSSPSPTTAPSPPSRGNLQSDSRSHWRAVNLIVNRYGDTARAESAKRADDLAATGDDAGVAKLSPYAAAPSRQSSTTGSVADRCPGADGGVCVRLDVTSFAGHIGHNAAVRPYR